MSHKASKRERRNLDKQNNARIEETKSTREWDSQALLSPTPADMALMLLRLREEEAAAASGTGSLSPPADQEIETLSEEDEETDEMKLSEDGKKTDERKLSEDGKKTDERKLSEDGKKTDERKLSEDGKKTEERKLSEDGKKTDERKLSEDGKKTEERKLSEDGKKAEERKLSEDGKKTDERKLSEDDKMTDERKLSEDGKKIDERKLSEDGKKIDERKLSEEAKMTDERKLSEDGNKIDERKLSEDGKKIDERKLSEDGKMTDERKLSEDGKKIDERKLSEDGKRIDERKLSEDGKKIDERKFSEDGKMTDERKLSEDGKKTDERKLSEDGKMTDERKLSEDGKKTDKMEKTSVSDHELGEMTSADSKDTVSSTPFSSPSREEAAGQEISPKRSKKSLDSGKPMKGTFPTPEQSEADQTRTSTDAPSEAKSTKDLKRASKSKSKDLQQGVLASGGSEILDSDTSELQDTDDDKTRSKKKVVSLAVEAEKLEKELEAARGEFDPREYVRTDPVIVGGVSLFLQQENVHPDVAQNALEAIADPTLTNKEVIRKLSLKKWPDQATKRSTERIVSLTRDIDTAASRRDLPKAHKKQTQQASDYMKRIRQTMLEAKPSDLKQGAQLPTWADLIEQLILYHENSDKHSRRRFSPHWKADRERGEVHEGRREDISGKAKSWTSIKSDDHKEDCKAYLARHKIHDMFAFLTTAVVHELPDDPLTFLIALTHEMGRHYDVELMKSRYEQQTKMPENDNKTCCM